MTGAAYSILVDLVHPLIHTYNDVKVLQTAVHLVGFRIQVSIRCTSVSFLLSYSTNMAGTSEGWRFISSLLLEYANENWYT
jgi:hypothetical protein